MSPKSEHDLPQLDDILDEVMADERRDCLRGPDSPEGRALGAAVGANVRRARAMADIGLEELESRSGIPCELLAMLEGGQAVPSLRALWGLATALGVPFAALLLQREGAVAFRVLRVGQGRMILSAGGELRSRLLSPPGVAPEVYELTLGPGCVEEAAPHAPGTVEHLTVLRGCLEVYAGDESARLEVGAALVFQADRPHGYRNGAPGETVAQLVMGYGPPAGGTRGSGQA
jgi:transcriptional regulator with XRE-family HTH domain